MQDTHTVLGDPAGYPYSQPQEIFLACIIHDSLRSCESREMLLDTHTKSAVLTPMSDQLCTYTHVDWMMRTAGMLLAAIS